jgi:hypothetical protein
MWSRLLFSRRRGNPNKAVKISGMLCIAGEIHWIYWPAEGNEIKRGNTKRSHKKSVDSCSLRLLGVKGVNIPSRRPGTEMDGWMDMQATVTISIFKLTCRVLFLRRHYCLAKACCGPEAVVVFVLSPQCAALKPVRCFSEV